MPFRAQSRVERVTIVAATLTLCESTSEHAPEELNLDRGDVFILFKVFVFASIVS